MDVQFLRNSFRIMKENHALQVLEALIGSEGTHTSPSPYMQWLNGRLLEADEGRVKVGFTVRKEMCNPAMILHGGVISGMIDEVVGIAVFSLGRDKFFTSVNLNVDFLRPAKLGEDISVTAKVVRSGSRIIHVAAEMHKEELLLARGQTNLIVTDDNLPQFKA